MTYSKKQCNNFYEHGFDFKIQYTHETYYGYLHNIKIDEKTDENNFRVSGLNCYYDNLIYQNKGLNSNMLVWTNFGIVSPVIVIGNKSFNLKYYKKKEIIEIMKKIGIEVK